MTMFDIIIPCKALHWASLEEQSFRIFWQISFLQPSGQKGHHALKSGLEGCKENICQNFSGTPCEQSCIDKNPAVLTQKRYSVIIPMDAREMVWPG